MFHRVRRKPAEGQELVEYALVLPLFLLLVLGLIEFAVLFFSYNTIANAAREGARYGIIYDEDTAGIEDRVEALVLDRALGMDPGALSVQATRTGTIAVGTIRVEVTYQAPLLTGMLLEAFGGSPTVPLRTVATMKIE